MFDSLKLIALAILLGLALWRIRQHMRVPEIREGALLMGVCYVAVTALFIAIAIAFGPGEGMERLSPLTRGLVVIMFILLSALCIIGPARRAS